ncbi:hypothetical protein [Amycolatopsis jiangsuensis]|nr:hypothetical protein [Amycolatopsis jiangsuensis]
MRNPEPGLPGLSLPPTVVAGHLRSCAEELAGSLRGHHEAATLGELAEVVTQLVAGQHALAHALAGLAGRVDVRNGALAAASTVDVEVVTEILQAAACAAGCSAEALADAQPSFDCVRESAGPETRV